MDDAIEAAPASGRNPSSAGSAPVHAPGLPRAQSLARAAALVRAVAAAPAPTTAELARACELPVATAARLLATLSDEGFVERTPDGDGWAIGLPLVRLARAGDPDRALLAAGRPVLEDLAAAAGESAALAVARPGPAMDVIAQAAGPGLLGVSDWVGVEFPLHASAPGKLVLAELDDAALAGWVERVRPERFTPRTVTSLRGLRAELAAIRARGWAELDGELERELASVAATVRGPRGRAVGFIGVSGPSGRLDAARRRRLAPTVRAAAERLARAAASAR